MAAKPPNEPELPEQPPYKYEPTYQPGPYPAGPYPYGYEPYKDGPVRRRGIGWLGVLILIGLALIVLVGAFYFGMFTPAAI